MTESFSLRRNGAESLAMASGSWWPPLIAVAAPRIAAVAGD
jgi:hypothetical protein